MGLLLDDDYSTLSGIGITFEEDESKQCLILHNYKLPEGIYNVDSCSVLVVIPTNYNDAGIDCIWVAPHLLRKDGKTIPRASSTGAGENHNINGQEYCRWSRHWNKGHNDWKPGISNIKTILRRLRWAFENPDADQ